MLPVLSALGGAAFSEIRRRKDLADNTSRGDAAQSEALKQLKNEEARLKRLLESIQKELVEERKAKSLAEQRACSATAETKKTLEKMARIESQAAVLQREHEEIAKENETLNAKREELLAAQSELQEHNEALHTRNEDLLCMQAELQGTNTSIEQQRAALKDRNEALQAELQQLASAQESLISSHAEEVETLKSEMNKLKGSVTGLLDNFADGSVTGAQLINQLSNLGIDCSAAPESLRLAAAADTDAAALAPSNGGAADEKAPPKPESEADQWIAGLRLTLDDPTRAVALLTSAQRAALQTQPIEGSSTADLEHAQRALREPTIGTRAQIPGIGGLLDVSEWTRTVQQAVPKPAITARQASALRSAPAARPATDENALVFSGKAIAGAAAVGKQGAAAGPRRVALASRSANVPARDPIRDVFPAGSPPKPSMLRSLEAARDPFGNGGPGSLDLTLSR